MPRTRGFIWDKEEQLNFPLISRLLEYSGYRAGRFTLNSRTLKGAQATKCSPPRRATSARAPLVSRQGLLQVNGSTDTLAAPLTLTNPMNWSGANSIDVLNGTENFKLTQNVGGTNLTKLGQGTLVLAGTANSYSGTLAVSAGTLQFGDGGADGNLGTTGGAITDNGILIFDTSTNFSQGSTAGTGVISGSVLWRNRAPAL